MHSDLGLTIDLDQVRGIVNESDVFAMGFRASPDRLLVDTRSSAASGPFVRVVPPVASMQERMFWLSQQRPGFGVPKRFAFFFWPHSVRFLQQTGIWQLMLDRIAATGHPTSLDDARLALSQLSRLEHQATIDAITGERHRTLWPQ